MVDMVLRKLEKPNTKGDRVNMLTIFLMTVAPGVNRGVIAAIPIILKNRKVSFDDQGEFSITAWPSCLKVLLAPIIDCVYSRKFGRRKTWLIPVQYLMGITLLFASMNLDDWLGSEDGTRSPNVHALSFIFCVSAFLNCVQDISLDSWSLNMLHKRNIGYVAICQTSGSITGFILSYFLFIVLDSKDFCNQFRTEPRDYGFVSSSDFLLFCSIAFFVWTTVILIFKRENSPETVYDTYESSQSLVGSYKLLWSIVNIRPILKISLILFTSSIGYGPLNGVVPLKIIDVGMAQEHLVLLSLVALPLKLILSTVLSRWLTGPRAMSSFILVQISVLIFGGITVMALFFSSKAKNELGTLPENYYWTLCFLFIVIQIIRYFVDVTVSGLGCRVSDPQYGGIYLTLIWTMMSAGNSWPTTLALYCVDWLTIKTCTGNEDENCSIIIDGFYTETVLFTAVGAFWLLCWCRKEMHKLENLEASAWIVDKKRKIVEENTNGNFIVHPPLIDKEVNTHSYE